MTPPPTNVLFLAAGRRVSLVREFKAALAELGDTGLAITEDAARSAPAHVVSDRQAALPRCTEPGYVEQLMALCERERVRMLVPLIDTVLPVLAPHRAAFERIGVTALVSSPETIAIGHHKGRTGDSSSARLRYAAILAMREIGALTQPDFPLFVKPPSGSSSIGAEKVRVAHRPGLSAHALSDLLVMELVDGDGIHRRRLRRLTGIPRCAVPRRRLETRAGEVSKGLTVRDAAIIEASMAVAAALPGAVGCITLQCFKRPMEKSASSRSMPASAAAIR